ncbi:MAG: EamA family transporter, partial [SAR324 cluster bacterium]|nr:EamA family transporter [SAR324 cluster bacterium]
MIAEADNFSVDQPVWQGPLYAVFAYGTWGLLPVYWKLFVEISALEVLVHRILWSVIFLLILVSLRRRLFELFLLIKNPKQLLLMLTTS